MVANIAENQWSHVVGTYDGTTLRLYVNGVLQGTNSFSGPINYQPSNLQIGKGAGAPNGFQWKGGIDEAAVYDRSLSENEVQALYNAGLSGQTLSLKSTAQITVTIQGANDAPVASVDSATAVEAGGVSNGTAGTNPTVTC